MQNRYLIILLFSAVCLSLSSSLLAADLNKSNQELLKKISKNINQYPVIDARFIQSKQMKALKRPLITKGRVSYSKAHGILWQIFQPFEIHYILGEHSVIEVSASGLRKEKKIADMPGLAQIGRLFRAMLSLDTDTLSQYFEVETYGNPKQWTLTLRPKASPIAQSLSEITLSGKLFVESIELHEKQGDQTNIQFIESQGKASLSNTEQKLLSNIVTP